MSLDIDLNHEDDTCHVSLTCSAGVVRFFIGERLVPGRERKFFELTRPIPTENLLELKKFLDTYLEGY